MYLLRQVRSSITYQCINLAQGPEASWENIEISDLSTQDLIREILSDGRIDDADLVALREIQNRIVEEREVVYNESNEQQVELLQQVLSWMLENWFTVRNWEDNDREVLEIVLSKLWYPDNIWDTIQDNITWYRNSDLVIRSGSRDRLMIFNRRRDTENGNFLWFINSDWSWSGRIFRRRENMRDNNTVETLDETIWQLQDELANIDVLLAIRGPQSLPPIQRTRLETRAEEIRTTLSAFDNNESSEAAIEAERLDMITELEAERDSILAQLPQAEQDAAISWVDTILSRLQDRLAEIEAELRELMSEEEDETPEEIEEGEEEEDETPEEIEEGEEEDTVTWLEIRNDFRPDMHTWVISHIEAEWRAPAEITNPTRAEIVTILEAFQTDVFSRRENFPPNSAQAVYAMQVTLSHFWHGNGMGQIDGVFWNMTRTAVRRFQTENRLGVDGVPWPQTIGKMIELLNQDSQTETETE